MTKILTEIFQYLMRMSSMEKVVRLWGGGGREAKEEAEVREPESSHLFLRLSVSRLYKHTQVIQILGQQSNIRQCHMKL